MPAWAAPPRFSAKNSAWTFLGFPSEIVQATIMPNQVFYRALFRGQWLYWLNNLGFGSPMPLGDPLMFHPVFGPLAAFTSLRVTLSAVLLIAPSARHRARFRDRDKEALIVSSNQLTLAATAFLAAAMVAVVILVGDYLYNWVVGAVAGAVTFGLVAWFWYGWGISRNVRRGD